MKKFKTYSEYKSAVVSEKITIAHIEAKQYLFTFTSYSGNVYDRSVDHVVTSMKLNGSDLTEASSIGTVVSGTYYYDITANKLYVYSTDIGNDKFLATYRLFFSSAPLNLSYDLNYGHEVYYKPRLRTSIPYSVKTDSSAIGTALIASGNMTLTNTDRELDSYGKFYFENQNIKVYSYSRNMPESEIKLIYDGIIVTKTFTDKDIKFKINNKLDFINNLVSLELYPELSNISESVQNTYKSRVFGRVDGLQCQSVSVVGENFDLTGTISGTETSTAITGTSTSFLSELSPDDELTLSDGQVVTVETITDNTHLVISDGLDSDVSGVTVTVVPFTPSPNYNRTWQVSSSGLRETECNINSIPFVNALELDDIRDLEQGDIVSVNGQTRVIDSISGNRIVVTQSFLPIPTTSDTVVRKPVQKAYYLGKELSKNAYNISNSSSGCQLVFDIDTEESHFLSRTVDSTATYTISSGSRTISRDSGTNDQLPELIKTRDYIQVGNSDFYEVLQVSSSTVTIRTAISATYTNQKIKVKSVIGIEDDSIISVDVLGETVDGEIDGIWIKNSSKFILKMLTEQGLSDIINTNSFTEVENNQDFTISLVIPSNQGSSKSEKLKTIFNKITQSTFTSLSLDSNFQLTYNSVDTSVDFDNLITITDHDIVSWSNKTEQSDLFNDISATYNEKQINTISEDSSSSIVLFENELATDIGINKTDEFSLNLYRESEAYASVQRKTMLSQSLNNTIEIKSDLRYSDLELGQVVITSLQIVDNFGDTDDDKRLMTVISIKKDGESITFGLSDLSNLFVKRAIITENTISDYVSATNDEILINSWITEDNGTNDDNDNTYGRNIII